MTDSLYHVGDRIRIVDEPYTHCPFAWVYEMDKCCGMTGTIVREFWVEYRECYGYYVDLDQIGTLDVAWCEKCFTPEYDDAICEVDLDELKTII